MLFGGCLTGLTVLASELTDLLQRDFFGCPPSTPLVVAEAVTTAQLHVAPDGPLHHAVPAVTLEHDLTTILDLPDIGSVLIQSYVPDQEDLAIVYEPGKGK